MEEKLFYTFDEMNALGPAARRALVDKYSVKQVKTGFALLPRTGKRGLAYSSKTNK